MYPPLARMCGTHWRTCRVSNACGLCAKAMLNVSGFAIKTKMDPSRLVAQNRASARKDTRLSNKLRQARSGLSCAGTGKAYFCNVARAQLGASLNLKSSESLERADNVRFTRTNLCKAPPKSSCKSIVTWQHMLEV